MHPFKKEAESSHKSKTGSMGKANNLDIPIMRAVGENKSGGIHVSSASMQHKNQSVSDGMKRGGHVGKPKHHKPKIVIAAPATDPASSPQPDPAMAAAGAGPSPAPAPMMPGAGAPPPGQPPMKRGGMVKGQKGGDNGMGRLSKAKAYGLKPIRG